MITAVTNNEAIDGSISKLFSNCAIVKNALVVSSYESFTVTNSLNVFITARRRRQARERQNTIIYSETRLIRKPKGHVLLPVLSGAGSKKKTSRIHFFNEKTLLNFLTVTVASSS